MSRWIPVTEQLPDADLVVLIACDQELHNEPVWIGYYDPSHQGTPWRDAEGMPAFVTHWQNLPLHPSVTDGVSAAPHQAFRPSDADGAPS